MGLVSAAERISVHGGGLPLCVWEGKLYAIRRVSIAHPAIAVLMLRERARSCASASLVARGAQRDRYARRIDANAGRSPRELNRL